VTFRPFGGALLITATTFLGNGAPQEVQPEPALAQAEARWKARKPPAYEYEIYVSCAFCGSLFNARARVVNGVTGEGKFSSVEKLFEVIRQAISRGQYRVKIEYDQALGYPVSADLDPRREVKDEELVFHVRGFRGLQVPAPETEARDLVRRFERFKAALQGGGNPTPEEERRRVIYIRLRQLGAAAAPALIGGLGNTNVHVRRNVALYLNWEGGNYSKHMSEGLDLKPFASSLFAALQDTDERVKGLSAQAIAHLGPDGAVAMSDLVRLLADASEGLRNSACIALAGIGPAASAALPALQRALSDPSSDVRKLAQNAIDKISRKLP
jgi:hypothetical protein